MMHRLDNDADPFWFEYCIDRFGDREVIFS